MIILSLSNGKGSFMPNKTAIMQPYLFPYIGYWQIINAVDNFILLDDVNFIMRGYINRNTILVNNESYLFSMPLDKASQNKQINHINRKLDLLAQSKLLKTIEISYRNAPYYKDVFPIITNTIKNEEMNLSKYLKYSIDEVLKYLEIERKISLSSEINNYKNLRGQDRIIDICKQNNTSIYINAIGGQYLYNKTAFAESNIELKFIKTMDIKYQQFTNKFISNLSIIDVLMFNSINDVKNILEEYILV